MFGRRSAVEGDRNGNADFVSPRAGLDDAHGFEQDGLRPLFERVADGREQFHTVDGLRDEHGGRTFHFDFDDGTDVGFRGRFVEADLIFHHADGKNFRHSRFSVSVAGQSGKITRQDVNCKT